MNNKINKIILMLSLLLVAIGCDSEDDSSSVFGENPTARQNEQQSELKNALVSSEFGWKMTYFTDDPRYTNTDQQLGGWTFIMRFDEDGQVSMISDYSSETLTPKQSMYDITIGSTTKLVFSTRNWISFLADSGNYPTSALEGYGYKGDNEFLYYGKEGEDLVFRSNREQIQFKLEPATAEDWDNLEEARQIGQLLSNNDLTLEIDNGNEVLQYNLSYNSTSRYVRNQDSLDLSFGIAFKPDGLKVIKPITVEGEQAIDFTFDQNNSWFIAELSNGKSVKIIVDQPDPTAQLFEEYYYSFQIFSGSPALNSSGAFVAGFNDAYANVEANNETITLFGFFLVPFNNTIQYIFYDDSMPNDPFSIVVRNITYEVDIPNDRIIISGNGGWEDPSLEPLLEPLENIIFDPEGLRLIDTGDTFDGDPVYGFRNFNDPNSIFYTYGLQ